MLARPAFDSHPVGRLVVTLVAIIAAALLLGIAAHHDDTSTSASTSATAASFDAEGLDSAAPVAAGSDELLVCSLAVLCCLAILAVRRQLRGAPSLGGIVRIPTPETLDTTRSRPFARPLSLIALSISRT